MLREFFNGRYGMDNLTLALLLSAAILININYIWIAGVVLLGYGIFRVLSKNIDKRYQELQRFNKIANKVSRYLNPVVMIIAKGLQSLYKKYVIYKTRLQQRKQYVFTKCPECKNILRLPRNKGKLSVTCPVCKFEFLKKT